MILREMLVDDLDAVMEIEESLFSVPWTREGMFTFLTRDDTMFLAVEENGTVIGYIGCLMVLDEADILNVAVRSDRQKYGIGGFLVSGLLRLLAEMEIRTVHLEVRTGNETARRLYERNGFTVDGIRKNYYTDPTEDAVLMTYNG
ncbi:MAG: ribosomal protein S18-alanine N-acetyltransferase [Blautia sp.]|nr:ribosomal protein S18-alanine N-acetyltransferase [Blautia sp.]